MGGEASVIAGGVAKLEGQKFTACVSGRWRRLAAGAGWERGGGCVCEERRERARDARGKEGLWAGGKWSCRAGEGRGRFLGKEKLRE